MRDMNSVHRGSEIRQFSRAWDVISIVSSITSRRNILKRVTRRSGKNIGPRVLEEWRAAKRYNKRSLLRKCRVVESVELWKLRWLVSRIIERDIFSACQTWIILQSSVQLNTQRGTYFLPAKLGSFLNQPWDSMCSGDDQGENLSDS